MRKIIVLLLLVTGALTVSAQKYSPNTKWPYVYENFTEGTIFFDGNKKTKAQLNIHLWGNKLHYLSNEGRIFTSDDKDVIRVEIGSDAYIYSDHKLVRIVAVDKTNLLVELTKADFDALFTSTGAYGSSLNSSSSRDLSSLDLGGMENSELGLMLQEKNDGRDIPLKKQYLFVLGGKQIEATKKSVESVLSADGQKDWKDFQKQNKIKWKNEESLSQVLTFISSHM
jgi:hypothetical protein